MSEALDRAVTELANRFRIEPSDDLSEYRDAALAVLKSIREPTLEMRTAGERILDVAIAPGNTIKCWELAEQVFQAMIEEALK